jgi:hypothetical protein
MNATCRSAPKEFDMATIFYAPLSKGLAARWLSLSAERDFYRQAILNTAAELGLATAAVPRQGVGRGRGIERAQRQARDLLDQPRIVRVYQDRSNR